MQNVLTSMNLPQVVQKLMRRYFDYGELFKVEGYEFWRRLNNHALSLLLLALALVNTSTPSSYKIAPSSTTMCSVLLRFYLHSIKNQGHFAYSYFLILPSVGNPALGIERTNPPF